MFVPRTTTPIEQARPLANQVADGLGATHVR
jgi:hypothetical protein